MMRELAPIDPAIAGDVSRRSAASAGSRCPPVRGRTLCRTRSFRPQSPSALRDPGPPRLLTDRCAPLGLASGRRTPAAVGATLRPDDGPWVPATLGRRLRRLGRTAAMRGRRAALTAARSRSALARPDGAGASRGGGRRAGRRRQTPPP